MLVSISSRMQRFIEEKLKAGVYTSAEEVVEAGLMSLQQQATIGDLAPDGVGRPPAKGTEGITSGDLMDGEQVLL